MIVTVVPIVTEALGTVSKNPENRFNELEIRGRIYKNRLRYLEKSWRPERQSGSSEMTMMRMMMMGACTFDYRKVEKNKKNQWNTLFLNINDAEYQYLPLKTREKTAQRTTSTTTTTLMKTTNTIDCTINNDKL